MQRRSLRGQVLVFPCRGCTYQPHGGGPRQIASRAPGQPRRGRKRRGQQPIQVRGERHASRGKGGRGPEIDNACSGRSAMQRRSLRGQVLVFPRHGLHLPAPRRRTAPNLRAEHPVNRCAAVNTAAATEPRFEAKDTRVAEGVAEVSKSTMPARAGAQCNVDLCAARYSSFHAADCTYQPTAADRAKFVSNRPGPPFS